MIPDRRSVTFTALNGTDCRIEAWHVIVSAAVDKLMFLSGRLRKTDIILTYQQIHDEFIKLMPADWECTSEYNAFMDYLSGNYVHEYAITEPAVDFVLDS